MGGTDWQSGAAPVDDFFGARPAARGAAIFDPGRPTGARL